MDPTGFVQTLLRANGLTSTEFKKGPNKIFLRSEELATNIAGDNKTTIILNIELINEYKLKIQRKWRCLYIIAVFVSRSMY